MIKDIDCFDIDLVGNKALRLAELKRKGFLVPNFYVIPIGQDFSGEVKLNPPFSIRSGSVNSLAGLLTTYLNVGRNDVVEKVKKVKASWSLPISQKVINYLGYPNVGTAVIIQEMLNKEDIIGSGVASCVNPITRKQELCLSYIKEAYCSEVVMGSELDKCPFEQEVLELLLKINKVFNTDQEIEFSITSEGIQILQSRDVIFSKETICERENEGNLIGIGLGSNSGIIKGNASFCEKSNSIFCLKELNPQDIDNIIKAKAILSKKGDHNCHISVLCRLLKKPYIVGAKLDFNISKDDELILNTKTGEVFIL